jgi:hypothetical protein
MRNLYLLATLILWSCVRNPTSPSALLEENEAIVFPQFSGPPVKMGGQPGMPYELDGVTLRALSTALNDFLPSGLKDPPCWNRLESYRYRVIRQESIIYIRIHADPASCEGKFLMLDSGVRYAITTEGRILRRLFTGEPEWDSGSEVSDGGVRQGTPHDAGEPDLAPVLGTTWQEPRPSSPRVWPDGGVGGTPSDGGDSAPPKT